MYLKNLLGILSFTALAFSFSAYSNHGHGGGNNGGGYGGRNNDGGGYGGGRQCIVEMQTIRGRTIQTFRAKRCRRAKRQCENALSRRQSNGRNPWASCLVTRRNNNGGGYGGGRNGGDRNGGGYAGNRERRIYTCTANDNGWEEHFGGHQARGYDEMRTRRKARRFCERVHGSCYVRCDFRYNRY